MYSVDSDAHEMALVLFYRLRSFSIKNYPFAHFYGQETFDDETSRSIQKYWPSSDVFSSISQTRRVVNGGYTERHLISLPELSERFACDPAGKNFWNIFRKAILGDWFLASVAEWWWPIISSCRSLPQQIQLYSECILTDDRVGYALGPHTDAPSRLLTILFYVPPTKNEGLEGTSLYVPRAPVEGLREPSPVHRRREDFYRVFTAPFIRDACLGFAVGPTSFHGVERLTDRKSPRRQIQFCIRFRKLEQRASKSQFSVAVTS